MEARHFYLKVKKHDNVNGLHKTGVVTFKTSPDDVRIKFSGALCSPTEPGGFDLDKGLNKAFGRLRSKAEHVVWYNKADIQSFVDNEKAGFEALYHLLEDLSLVDDDLFFTEVSGTEHNNVVFGRICEDILKEMK